MDKKNRKALKSVVKEAVCEVATENKEKFKGIVKCAVGEALKEIPPGAFSRPSGGYHVHYHGDAKAEDHSPESTIKPKPEKCPDIIFEISVNTNGAISHTKRIQ